MIGGALDSPCWELSDTVCPVGVHIKGGHSEDRKVDFGELLSNTEYEGTAHYDAVCRRPRLSGYDRPLGCANSTLCVAVSVTRASV